MPILLPPPAASQDSFLENRGQVHPRSAVLPRLDSSYTVSEPYDDGEDENNQRKVENNTGEVKE